MAGASHQALQSSIHGDAPTIATQTSRQASSPRRTVGTTQDTELGEQELSVASPEPQALPDFPDESTIRAHSSPAKASRFKPFYTIVSDTTSPTSPKSYYPRIRYIFDDDDPDLLSSALSMQHGSLEKYHEAGIEPAAVGSFRPETSDRAVLLHLSSKDDYRDYKVAWATSLSAEWAVTDTHLGQLDEHPSEAVLANGEYGPLILDVEGVDVSNGIMSSELCLAVPRRKQSPLSECKERPYPTEGCSPPEDYNKLIRDFDRRMGLLKKVVQNSDDRRSELPGAETRPEGEPQQLNGGEESQRLG